MHKPALFAGLHRGSERFDPTRRARQRGATLVEAVLYLVIASGMITLSGNMIYEEQQRQQDIVAASNLKLILEASQRYIAGRYDSVREQLFSVATSNGTALMTVPMQNLVDDGYLPQTFMNNPAGDGVQNYWKQDYALLVRAVNRVDNAEPQETLLLGQLDTNGDGFLDPQWIDGSTANGEMDLEAILVTTNGESVPLNRSGPVIVRTSMATAGTVREAGLAAGPFGNWELDISPFETLPEYPTPGHFASLVALSKYGAIDTVEEDTQQYLSRCRDIITEMGLTEGSQEYQNCRNGGNAVYSSIVFNYDLNADGVDDIFPAIAGLREIKCGPATGLASIADQLRIDCSLVETAGNLAVEGTVLSLNNIDITSNGTSLTIDSDLTVTGDALIEGNAEAERFISASLNNGQDLNAGIYDARILTSGDTVAKPICPPFILVDGAETAVAPRIYVVPAANADPQGISIVGVRAFAQDIGDEWRVRLVQYVSRDEATLAPADLASALSTGTPGASNRLLSTAPGPDGRADAYELGSDYGRVMVMTRCY